VPPSTELRTWYAHDPQRFQEFARRYTEEFEEPERSGICATWRRGVI
jgi:uncharacterized protein YeaO (DUF488 family)